MASRSETAFTHYVDEKQLLPRKKIIFTQPNNVANDQDFALKIKSIILADCFVPQERSNAAYATLLTIPVKGIDKCGTGASETSKFSVLAWASDASNFTVSVRSDGATENPVAVTANHTSKIWRALTSITMPTGQDSEMDIEIRSKRDAGAGTIYVGGILIISA